MYAVTKKVLTAGQSSITYRRSNFIHIHQPHRFNLLRRTSASDPRVTTEGATTHHLPHEPSLIPLDGQRVPPDPTVLALEQPVGAALAYAAREVLLHVALPLFALWLLQKWLDRLEKHTREQAVASTAASGGGGSGATLPLFRQLGEMLPVAATAPSWAALTLLTATHVARSIANIVQGLAERALVAAGGPDPNDLQLLLERGRAGQLLHTFKSVLVQVDRGLLVLYQVALVGFGCWTLLRWKAVALNRFLVRSQDTSQGRQQLERVLTPLNTFATWALLTGAGVLVVQLLGMDVRPLLLVTGWSSVLAGLASQQLLANAVSGVQIYLDRPFQVGDTISVVSGVTRYCGEVVQVEALRTHLALEDGAAVAIPNRSLADMIITNKSRSGRRLTRPPWYHSRAPLSLKLHVQLCPPDYGDSLSSELEELRLQVVGSGAVEVEGPLAPRVEVQCYSERGVEVLVQCRLRNPAKVASSAATGSLAALAPPVLQLIGAGGIHYPYSSHGHDNSASRTSDSGDVQQASSRTKGPGLRDVPYSREGNVGHGGGDPMASRAMTIVREDAPRQLRQQLILALGPWLHARNATLVAE